MTKPLFFIGEPLALDLINTRPLSSGGRQDLLATPEGLQGWLECEAERLEDFSALEAAQLAPEALAPIHAVREHAMAVIACLRQGEPPPESALQGLNDAIRAAPPIRELSWQDSAVRDSTHREGPFPLRLAAHLAEAVVDLLVHPAIGSLRECEAEDCIMLFLATNPRRRWCSAARCGNRARVARYYQRRKAT